MATYMRGESRLLFEVLLTFSERCGGLYIHVDRHILYIATGTVSQQDAFKRRRGLSSMKLYRISFNLQL